jgi:hypothetical protein
VESSLVPRDVMDAAMHTPAARRLVAFMARGRGEDEITCERWMRVDLADVIAEALIVFIDPPSARTRPLLIH